MERALNGPFQSDELERLTGAPVNLFCFCSCENVQVKRCNIERVECGGTPIERGLNFGPACWRGNP